MHLRRPTLPLMLLGLLAACNSSTSPNATVAGTWHVSVGALDSGSVAPTTFNFVVTASGDSFLITAPTLTWSVGTLTFDSTVSMIHFSSATYFGFQEIPKVGTQHCRGIQVFGLKNSADDTLTSAVVDVFNSDTIPGGFCQPVATGSATITK
jgi:hypothetical protein